MKHLLRAVVFIALLSLLLPQVRAQDVDPATYNFGSTSPTAFRSDTARQNYKGFVLGLNWGALPYPARMMDSLNVNVIHEGTWIHNGSGSARDLFDTLATLKKGKKLIHADYLLSQGKPAPYAWAMSMEFDPNRTGASSIYRFEERYKDTIATWGFNVRKIGVTPPLGDTGTVNYSRYMLRADSITNHYAGVPQLVLSDPQPNNQLFTDKWMYDIRGNNHNLFVSDYAGNALHDFDTQLRGGDTTIVYMRGDSTEWWVAVNLRRLEKLSQNALPDSTSVLSIRVPLVRRIDSVASDGKRYAVRRDTVYATFDSTAVVGTTIAELSGGLGKADGALSMANTTTFIVRKGMLPAFDALPRPDITLSAHFWLPKTDIRDRFKLYDKLYRDSVMVVGSPMRAPDPETQAVLATQALGSIIVGPTTPYLDTLVERVLMDVTYHGKVDVGLDYLRFENRLARQILRGKKDAMMIQRVNEIYNYMDNSTGAQSSKAELFRHYFADETPPMYWRVQRYLAQLLQKTGSIEGDKYFAGQYKQQSKAKETWITWGGASPSQGAPYLRYGATGGNDGSGNKPYQQRAYRTMSLPRGYRGTLNTNNAVVTPATFDYETYLENYSYGSQTLATLPDSLYLKSLDKAKYGALLPNLELFLRDFCRNDGIIYHKSPFWANFWMHSNYERYITGDQSGQHKKKVMVYNYNRPLTGEETRLWRWVALTTGGKGFLYHTGGSAVVEQFLDNLGNNEYDIVKTMWLGLTRAEMRSDQSRGGDFLDSQDSLYRYVDLSAMTQAMGIDTSRLYIGTRSVYDEVEHGGKWIRQNEQELMRLQLQAVYNKGYKLQKTRKDTTINIDNFLNLPLTPEEMEGMPTTPEYTASVENGYPHIVRRVHMRTGSTCPTCYEHWRDSTFFMLTLLKDSVQSMDKAFYVGVLNKRTDPTIYYPSPGGSALGDSIKFFSTQEFDSLVATGRLNSRYAYPQYAQAGTREITLPFNYKLSSGYALLHIEEVGGTLDTVIGQDKSLSLMFKPGEGKLLRVNVLKPGEVADGQLDYNGQRKLIAQELSGDSVCYHMAYYRRESSGRRRVYYSRSKATARSTTSENIIWETPVILSDSSNGIGTSIKNGDCAYPSIVVRYDSVAAQDRVYIVYACNKTDKDKPVADGEHHIVENTFLWNTSNASLTKDQKNKGKIVVRSQGDVLENWGTPVLNASARGNFYAWSDSIMGIGIGYKRPQDTFFVSTIYTRWGVSGDSAQHPSFNSYSRISSGENSAALVWQENNHIYYARPQYASATGLKLQSLASLYTPLNILRTITRLSDEDCCPYNRMPVIYRSVETGSTYKRWGINQPFTRERVFWEGRDSATATKSRIYRRVLDLGEIAGSYEIWLGVSPTPATISGNFYRLEQPNVVQGKVWYKQQNSDIINMSDSAYTLNFSGNVWIQPSSANRIWHVPLPYGWRASGQYHTSSFGSVVLLDRGQYPNLAAIKDLTPTSDWWMNRRVFQKGTTPDIVSSAQYYYRTVQPKADDALTQMIGYKKGNGSCNRYLIADTYIDNSPLAFYEPQIEIVTHPDTAMVLKADTLKSDWFSIGSTREVSFFGLGTDTSFVGMELVQQSTGTRTPVVLKPSVSATTATLVVKTFTNGGGGYYRLELFRKSTSASFVDDLYVGQLPYDSLGTFTYGKGSASAGSEVIRGGIVNLATSGTDETAGLHAYIYPNPAQDIVSISVYRTYTENMAVTGESDNNHVLVRVVSMLGTEVARFDAHTGDEIKLPVKALPKGVYFVRVEQVGNSQESSTTSFIVE